MIKIFLFLSYFITSFSGNTTAGNLFSNKTRQKDSGTVELWNVIDITLTSSKMYTDPLNEVEVNATFTGPGDKIITRPAFWDGGTSWIIRFAPTITGEWKMETLCSDVANSGLQAVTQLIKCKPYRGNLAIYKHGFLKVSPDKRYFVYDDGTPFFYLGDTHWIYIHERFSSSNVKNVASQFKYIVDKRVGQGFTVYQTEAIQQVHGANSAGTENKSYDKYEDAFCNFRDGFNEADIAGFKNIDRKFKYIASKGLVNANSSICWALDPAEYPGVYSENYMAKLGRYWVARYGAYPVLWTIAQEIDKNMYKKYDSVSINKWFAAGKAIAGNNSYRSPITAHMENTGSTIASNSWWGDKEYHQWWAVQWQGDMTDNKIAKDFWNHSPAKPSILYESPYEGFWTDAKGAREAGYKAFQYGMFGYGYGANGVWNDLYSLVPPVYGTGYEMPARFLSWYDGANLPGAAQLTWLKNFYSSIEWWKLIPRFEDSTWSSFVDKSQSLIATDMQNVYVVYFFNRVPATGTLKNLLSGELYTARWFDPRKGKFIPIGSFKVQNGNWIVPFKPDSDDWILLVQKANVK